MLTGDVRDELGLEARSKMIAALWRPGTIGST